MNWLFVHQNFPGQYVHAISRLVARGDRVVGIGQTGSASIPGITKRCYSAPEWDEAMPSPMHELDQAVRNGLAVARLCTELRNEGFTPNIVVGHAGWGETAYVKDIWPDCPLLGYFEFFYRASGADIDFDPEFPPPAEIELRLRTRNAINLMALDAVDAGHTATVWQRNGYPRRHHDRIAVCHEGIDTGIVRPDPSARIWLQGGLSLDHGDELVTFCARNLEPYRGFHVFMRALPAVLARRPNARILVIGGQGVSYGAWPDQGGSWRDAMLAELGDDVDLDRVHFLGRVPYRQFLSVLQLSTVHVYLTYPFVLSWSMLEAMAAGCVVVASATQPVVEVIEDGRNGLLVDFLDPAALADRITDVLGDRHGMVRMRREARQTVLDRYDLHGRCLPAFLRLAQGLAGIRAAA